MFLGRLARKVVGSPAGARAGTGRTSTSEGQDSSSPLKPNASAPRDKDRTPDASTGHPDAHVKSGQGRGGGSRPGKGAGAPGSRQGLSSHARKLLVPLVALFGLCLGSLMGGYLALRHAATCSATSEECWELRGKTFTRMEARGRRGRQGEDAVATGWMKERLNLHSRGGGKSDTQEHRVVLPNKGVPEAKRVSNGENAMELEAKLLREMGYKAGVSGESGGGDEADSQEQGSMEQAAQESPDLISSDKQQQQQQQQQQTRGLTSGSLGGGGRPRGAAGAQGTPDASARKAEVLTQQSSSSPGEEKQGTQNASGRQATGAEGSAGTQPPLPRLLPQLEDTALFRQALEVESPFNSSVEQGTDSGGDGDGEEGSAPARKRNGRIALLFLAKGQLPLARLWRRFLIGHKRHYSIYVHTTPGFEYGADALPRAFQGRQVLSKDLQWGRMSMVDAERRLLANALLRSDNARFVLLSDSCIPIYNFSYTFNYLMDTPNSFVRGSVYKGRAGTDRWNNNFLPLVPKRSFRKGLQWWVLTREAARAVVGDSKYYSVFKDNCRPASNCLPTEHYIQTMLYEVLETRMANRSLTWVEWSRGYTPLTFNAADIGPAVVRKVRAKQSCVWNNTKAFCYLFARKFRSNTLEPLLNLTSKLGYT